MLAIRSVKTSLVWRECYDLTNHDDNKCLAELMVSCRCFDVLVDITSWSLPINPLPLSPESWYTFDYRPEQQHRFPGRLCVHVSQYWFLRAQCSGGLWVVVMDRLMSRWRIRWLIRSYRKWIASFWHTSARRLRISLVVFCHRGKATTQTCGQ